MNYLDKDSEEKVDCAKCLDIPHAFCLAEPDDEPMKVRLDFDDMVEKMTKDPENKACSCAEGYLPIYHPESGYLMRCHDPIIKTATLGTNHNLFLDLFLFWDHLGGQFSKPERDLLFGFQIRGRGV